MLAVDNERLKAVIHDMRKQMEEYIEKDKVPTSSTNQSAAALESKIALLKNNLHYTEDQLNQANEYIELLQKRIGRNNMHSASVFAYM